MLKPLFGKPQSFQAAISNRNYGHPFIRREVGFYLLNEITGTTVYNLASPNLVTTGGSNTRVLPRTGTLTNTPLNWTGKGKFGSPGLNFAGSFTYVELGNSLSPLDYSSGSLVAWINMSATSSVANIIYRAGNTDTSTESARWMVYLNTVNATTATLGVQCLGAAGSGNDAVVTTVNQTTNKWYHVVVTGDGSTWKIYVNGVQQSVSIVVGSNTGAWWSVFSAQANWFSHIGANSSVNNYNFVGQIDHLRLYGRVLSPSEIKWMYQEPFADFGVEFGPQLSSRLAPLFIANRFEMAT